MGVGFIEELIPGDPPVPEDEILGSVGLLSARGCGGIIEKYKCVCNSGVLQSKKNMDPTNTFTQGL